MRASWILESTATTGTGTINLGGAVSGYQAFSNALVSGDTVFYEIVDGNNREMGWGTLTTGSPWTLSRDVIAAKLDSGTLTRYPATGISLSGSAKVGIAETGMSNPNLGSVPTKYLTSSGANFGDMCSFRFNYSQGQTTKDKMYTTPLVLLAPTYITYLVARIAIAGSGGTYSKLGLYKPAAPQGGRDWTKIDEASIDVTTTGVKLCAIGTPIWLPPGKYMVAFASDATTQPQVNFQNYYAYRTVAEYGYYFTGGLMTHSYNITAGWTTLPASLTTNAQSAESKIQIGVQ